MAETPVIITRTRRGERTAQQDFTFTPQPTVEGSEAIQAYRRTALEAFQATELPTTKEEAWRRTDLKALQPGRFRLPNENEYLELPAIPEYLLQPLVADVHGGQVVLLAGGSKVELNKDLATKGVVFTDLKTAQKQYPEIVEKILGKIVRPGEGKFAALAGAFGQNGVLLYVPKGVTIDQPLHSLVWGPGSGLAHLDHLLVYLEEGASVTYVHESASPVLADGEVMHAGIVEIFVGPAANLRFVELQSWGENVWCFSHERAHLEQDATMDWIFGAIGSHVTKNFSELDLVGKGSTARVSGFYFTDHQQHLDHDTQQNHLAPNTTSDLLYKGALLGESRSVWQGMIYVAPGAMKTDGYQANRNLVLSPKARADSIPGLEILADDVRCTHGATVGKLDEDLLFYLLSRGIARDDAERLIVEGFFDPIMQRIPFEGVRDRFQQAIVKKMESYKA
jgi:Fe-S cluster assembly protein SufD